MLWAFVHDTVGPRITQATAVDSITIQLDFAQTLAPGIPADSAISIFSLPDTIPVPILFRWNQVLYDSVRIVEAVADSVRLAALTDSLRAAEMDSLRLAAEEGDTLAATALATLLAEVEDSVTAQELVEEEEVVDDTLRTGLLLVADSVSSDSTAADSVRVAEMLSERPTLYDSWYVRLATSTTPGARYLIVATAYNLTGAFLESQAILILPELEPEPADTT